MRIARVAGKRFLVQQHTWLTRQQLLDAVAIGQFTPGQILSTATFIGYILGGVLGIVVATIGIFLPSFFYVGRVLFRLRQPIWIAAFLDSVNLCAVALMVGVTVRLGIDALRGWPAWLISPGSLAILLRWNISPAWIVLGGGIVGLFSATIR
jgi:chromate transporter